MDPNESIFPDGMDKLLKNYANYKNICEEFNRERENEQESYEKNTLPSLPLARRKYSRTICKNSNYSSKLLGACSSYRSEELFEEESLPSEPERDVLPRSEQEDDFNIERSSVGKKYEQKIRIRTAELQKEIDELKLNREKDMDESLFKIDSLEKILKLERNNSKEKFQGLVTHYEKILQQTKHLQNQMLNDYANIQTKMSSLKEQVRTLHTDLQTDLSNDFEYLLQGNAFMDCSSSLVPFKVSSDENTDKPKTINIHQEEKRPDSRGKFPAIYMKKQQKSFALKTRKMHCPRKEKENH